MPDAIDVLFCRPVTPQDSYDGFETEVRALEQLEIDCAFVPIEQVVDGELEVALETLPEDPRRYLYRGYILRLDEYEALHEALLERGHELVVDPAAYEAALHVPAYHPHIEDRAAPTVWTWGEDIDEAWAVANETLGPPPWLLKDHVKSLKEEWDDACFVPAGADRARFRDIARTFLELRGDRFEGGLVLRTFLDLRSTGVRTVERRIPDEHRLFFWSGELVAHAPYHEVGTELTDVGPYRELGRRIDSPFFTMDIAFLNAGGWVVVEVNDGGISTMPELMDPRNLYAAIVS